MGWFELATKWLEQWTRYVDVEEIFAKTRKLEVEIRTRELEFQIENAKRWVDMQKKRDEKGFE